MDGSLSQAQKGAEFRALHQSFETLILPNPWDPGTARLLTGLGFRALATSSGATAGTYGRRDGTISRDEALARAREICAATDLPVSADLENGFGDSPETVAETIRLAAARGLVGASIEDATFDEGRPIYDFHQSVERVAAAVEAASALSFPFTVTGRAENFLRNRFDLDDTIRRLQAYEQAGAHAVFAPGLPDLDAVRAVCSAVSVPVNFMIGLRGKSWSFGQLREVGVRRISSATTLYRTAMTAFTKAALLFRDGDYQFVETAMTSAEIATRFSSGS